MKDGAYGDDAADLLWRVLKVAAAPAEAPPSSLPDADRPLHLGAERLEGAIEGFLLGGLKNQKKCD